MNQLHSKIGARIKEIREAKRLSQADLARLLDVTPSYVSTLEKGDRNPSVGTLEKISKALGVSVDQMMSSTGASSTSDDNGLVHLNDGDSFTLAEDIPDIDFFFSHVWLRCFTNEFASPGGRAYSKVLSVYHGNNLSFYFGENDSLKVAESIVRRFIDEPDFVKEVNDNIVKQSDILRAFAEKVPDTHLDRLSHEELWQQWKKHHDLHVAYYQWAWIPVAVDMFHNNLTNTLKEYLSTKGLSEEKISEIFMVLTQPTKRSLIQQEYEDFLKIGETIHDDEYHRALFKDLYEVFQEQDAAPYGLLTHTPEYEQALEKKTVNIREKIKPAIYDLIQKHYQKYFYVKYMWVGKEGVTSFEHYLKELVKLIGRNSDVHKLLSEEEQKLTDSNTTRAALLKELSIEPSWQKIFDGFGDFMVTKIYRRYAQIYAVYRMRPILEEIAQRLSLTLDETRFLLPHEVEAALLNNTLDRREIKERVSFCVLYTEKDKEKVFVGEEAARLARMVEPKEVISVKEFKGQTGCVGHAQGIVKIITRPADMAKMNQGDILVSIATDPDIVPAMKKAAAIVTEQGGVTSHAAIVARELGIPCVIGTKIATKVLKDGDEVEVDATRGIVRIIK